MAKQKNQLHKRGTDLTLSQENDDSMFPSAEELEKLNAVDSEIPKFIRESAEREQTHRHIMQKEGIKISGREQLFTHGFNYFGMFGFIVIALALIYFSYDLIKSDKELIGGIFLGSTLLGIGYILVGRVKNRKV